MLSAQICTRTRHPPYSWHADCVVSCVNAGDSLRHNQVKNSGNLLHFHKLTWVVVAYINTGCYLNIWQMFGLTMIILIIIIPSIGWQMRHLYQLKTYKVKLQCFIQYYVLKCPRSLPLRACLIIFPTTSWSIQLCIRNEPFKWLTACSWFCVHNFKTGTGKHLPRLTLIVLW